MVISGLPHFWEQVSLWEKKRISKIMDKAEAGMSLLFECPNKGERRKKDENCIRD
jgi:hypothetical protein